jgi:hypothetical protein
MELVIASAALANALISEQLFTALVLMAVVTTTVTPAFLKLAYQRLPSVGDELMGLPLTERNPAFEALGRRGANDEAESDRPATDG